MKRTLDIVGSVLGMLVLSPLIFVVAVLVKFTSPGPILFRQERLGRHFRPFMILKFRTMVPDAPSRGKPITVGDDPRITRLGRFLRKTKLDELPQLFNVLKGDMSLVGPRPEVRPYVDLFREDYRTILQVRPGVTDLASLEFRDEASLLARSQYPEEEYRTHVLPEKIRLAKEYVQRASFSFDLWVIARTILILLGDHLPYGRRRSRPEQFSPTKE